MYSQRGGEGVITQTPRVRLSRNELFTQFHQASRGDRKFVCVNASFIVFETLSKSTNVILEKICSIDAFYFFSAGFLCCTVHHFFCPVEAKHSAWKVQNVYAQIRTI